MATRDTRVKHLWAIQNKNSFNEFLFICGSYKGLSTLSSDTFNYPLNSNEFVEGICGFQNHPFGKIFVIQ